MTGATGLDDHAAGGPEEPGLLPPSAEPVFPPELTEGGDLWYEPPVMPKPGESGYSVIQMDYEAPSPDFDWPNEARTAKPDPWLGMFEELREAPQWHSHQPEPDDFPEVAIGMTHTVSERVLEVFLRFDPDSVKYIAVDMRFAGGTPARHKYYWMHVTKHIAAVDFANSKIRYVWPKNYSPSPVQYGPTRLMPTVRGTPYFCTKTIGSRAIFLSEEMVRAFAAIEPPLVHFKTQDLSAWPFSI